MLDIALRGQSEVPPTRGLLWLMPMIRMFDLTGRVAILTGGAGLLGRHYTRTLLAAGAKVVVADVSGEQAGQAAIAATAEVGGEAIGWELDVRDKGRRRRDGGRSRRDGSAASTF